MKEEIMRAPSELPEWVVTLMRAYKEYTETLEAKDAE